MNMRAFFLVSGVLLAFAACDDDAGTSKPPPVQPPTTSGIGVTNPAVRGCDVLLEESGGEIAGVTFGETVLGEQSRWAPRTAVSFVMRSDAAPSGSLATVSVEAGGSVSIASASCYDRLGAPVASPGVALR
jgi:hypothetical protein